MNNWKHITSNEYDWDLFGDKHGRETSKVRYNQRYCFNCG